MIDVRSGGQKGWRDDTSGRGKSSKLMPACSEAPRRRRIPFVTRTSSVPLNGYLPRAALGRDIAGAVRRLLRQTVSH